MSAFRIVIELMRYRPRRFALSALLWSIMHGSPVVFGYLIGQIFDALTEEATVASNPWVTRGWVDPRTRGPISTGWPGSARTSET